MTTLQIDGERTTSIYREWERRIAGGIFTLAWCRQWAQAVVPLSESMAPGGHRTNLRDWEARDLRQQMWFREEGGVRLDDRTIEAGLRWLQQHGHRELGIPTELIEDFDHFMFEGNASLWDVGCVYAAPEWLVVCRGGRRFTYWHSSWQARRWSNAPDGAWMEVGA